MNNKGFGIKEVCIFLLVVLICMFVVTSLYHSTMKDLGKESGSYKELSDEMIEGAHTYTDNYLKRPLKDGDEGYVSSKELKEKDLIDDLRDVNNYHNKCFGYVHYYKNDGKTTYEAYLHCPGNYKTDGYDDSRD